MIKKILSILAIILACLFVSTDGTYYSYGGYNRGGSYGYQRYRSCGGYRRYGHYQGGFANYGGGFANYGGRYGNYGGGQQGYLYPSRYFYGLNYRPKNIHPECNKCQQPGLNNLCYQFNSNYLCSNDPCGGRCNQGYCALTSFGYHHCVPSSPCRICPPGKYCVRGPFGRYRCEDFFVVETIYQEINFHNGHSRPQNLCYFPNSCLSFNQFYPSSIYYQQPTTYRRPSRITQPIKYPWCSHYSCTNYGSYSTYGSGYLGYGPYTYFRYSIGQQTAAIGKGVNGAGR